jgi:hypothetical protein
MGAPAELAPRGLFSPSEGVRQQKVEVWCRRHLTDEELYQLLEKVDADLAQETREQGCPKCGGRLHRGDYARKPRGGPQWDKRLSFCCGQEGCRRRRTPVSVRFFGRRVYVGLVVVLVSAMNHGLRADRVRRLREWLGIDRRTLVRWRAWWLEAFVRSKGWKVIRARLLPPVCEGRLPWSLCVRFGVQHRDRLLDLLGFLARAG